MADVAAPDCSNVSSSDKLNDIKRLLEKRKFKDLNRAILDSKNSETLLNGGWDMVPLVCSLVTDRGFVEACANTLKNLAKVGNPKELLVVLLEQMDFLDAELRFQLLLGAMQTVLLRLLDSTGGTRSQKSLRWVLGALDEHVKNLPIPKSHGLEGKAKLLQDSDPDVMRIENAVQDLMQFCEPFLRRLLDSDDESSSATKNQRELLSGFLVQVFHPLAYVDIAAEEATPKGTLRVYAEKIVSDLCLLEADFHKFYYRIQSDSTSDMYGGGISLQALGTLLYIVHVEGHRKECLPCIYSHRHTLEASLPAILDLLRGSPNEFKIAKGLQLTEQLLKYVRNKEFGEDVLDFPSVTELVFCFERVAVFEKSIETRRLAIKLLPDLINKFDDDGRYKFVYALLNAIKHSGVKSIVVGTFKGHVHAMLESEQPLPLLVGQSLSKIVKVITALPQGVETDLMDDSERILAGLNFLRFLFLRDGADANVTGIWDVRNAIRRDFLDVVMKASEISRAHYQLEVKHQSEDRGKKSRSKATVSVEGVSLPAMPREQTIHYLSNVLTRLDMIHSVVVRVLEIMDGKK